MMQGCLATHVHYLDITGEIDVFELAHSVDEKAQRAESRALSGRRVRRRADRQRRREV